jgi:hypothetical protein
VKIAKGKFQGLMQAKTPRPCRATSLISPVGPAQLGDGVADGLARLAHAKRHEIGPVLLHEIGHAVETGRALPGRGRVPVARRALGPGQRLLHLRRVRLGDRADFAPAVRRIVNRPRRAVLRLAAYDGRGAPASFGSRPAALRRSAP